MRAKDVQTSDKGDTMGSLFKSLVVYRLVHPPVTRESGVRLPAREAYFFCFFVTSLEATRIQLPA